MPELPEVETIKRGLSNIIINQKIIGVDLLWLGSFQDFEANKQKIINSKIIAINRTGKLLSIDLSSGLSLVFHLKMTGQIVFRPMGNSSVGFGGGHPTKSLSSKLPDKSTRAIVRLSLGELFFNDQRKFGWIKVVETGYHEGLIKKMGPDILNVNRNQFIELIKSRPKSKLKSILLDQSFVSGIGNIYADESLNAAHLHPSTRVDELSVDQLSMLHSRIQSILRSSIELGGSSSKNYVNSKGEKGEYLDQARVYGRVGKDCKDCGSEIIKLKLAGRGTHICPTCQITVQKLKERI